MDDLLRTLARRPAPFSLGGPQELWTDPHVQQRMLDAHLDPHLDAASPTHDTIDRAVTWLVAHLDIGPTTRVLDLGCGPGLYASRLAGQAGHVHGIDLSVTSIAEARRRTRSGNTTFEVGDYRVAPLPPHEVAVLLMYDYGAMSPDGRQDLLRRVHATMTAGGKLILDVLSTNRYEHVPETCRIEEQLDDGFWAAGDYVGVAQTFRYDSVRVVLDRYLIVEPHRTRWVHNWFAHLTLEQLTSELDGAGFSVEEALADVTGTTFDPHGDTVAVVAGRRG
jgi:cyclopropane fatty-acyl-phospholipid synthase-like methyltransferase